MLHGKNCRRTPILGPKPLKTLPVGRKNHGQRFPKLRATLFKTMGNRIFAYQQPYLFPQLAKYFFLTGKIITTRRDARSLRPYGLCPGCVRMDPMRAREHYIILGIGKTGENCSMKWRNWAVEHSWNRGQRNEKWSKKGLFCAFCGAINAMFHGENFANYLIMWLIKEEENERTAQQKGSLSLSSLRGTIQVFLRIFLRWADPAFRSIKGVGTQRVALEKKRMRLRVKPAKTQIVRDLQITYK